MKTEWRNGHVTAVMTATMKHGCKSSDRTAMNSLMNSKPTATLTFGSCVFEAWLCSSETLLCLRSGLGLRLSKSSTSVLVISWEEAPLTLSPHFSTLSLFVPYTFSLSLWAIHFLSFSLSHTLSIFLFVPSIHFLYDLISTLWTGSAIFKTVPRYEENHYVFSLKQFLGIVWVIFWKREPLKGWSPLFHCSSLTMILV